MLVHDTFDFVLSYGALIPCLERNSSGLNLLSTESNIYIYYIDMYIIYIYNIYYIYIYIYIYI